MPRVKTLLPETPSREKGQRSLDLPFFYRVFPQWMQPDWARAQFWRSVVGMLPAATDCEEALIGYTTALEWKIEPRESTMRNELKKDIDYHTKFIEAGGQPDLAGWDFVSLLEWGGTEYLRTPFGFGAETIRDGDNPSGKVVKIIPLDSATLFPTINDDWPVAQRIPESSFNPVVFPPHAINRMYMSPRPEMKFKGWGMPPPEKIFLAIEMVRRGDLYYAKLLTDTPESGLLDLVDMSQESAEEWIEAFRELYTGIDPMKIPVLYQHTTPAKWIPFGKPPADLMFDKTYKQYVTLVCAGYGLSPTDIGFPSGGGGGGETLAGSIRDERKTRKQGLAKLKVKWKYFFDRILPPTLQFTWVDLDDEISVARARARLADATAFGQLIDKKIISSKESRLQMIADGTITIPIPEDVPEEEFDILSYGQPQGSPERPGMLGAPVKPSFGGHGEVLPRSSFESVLNSNLDIPDVKLRKLARMTIPLVATEANSVFRDLNHNEYDAWLDWHDKVLWSDLDGDIPELTLSTIVDSGKVIATLIESENWLNLATQDVTECVNKNVGLFTQIREDLLIERSQIEYEEGKIKTYITKVESNKELENKFKSEFRKELRAFWKTIPKSLSKAVIAGTRNAIIQMGKVQYLDTETNIDDNIYVVPYIKAEINSLKERLLSEFDERLINTISKILEEI